MEPAWALGFTGMGVTTGIMDDGIDYMHPDLEDNFVRSVSFESKQVQSSRLIRTEASNASAVTLDVK